jgi:dihydropteroate synthase
MICKTLNITPDEALNGTTAVHFAALMGGANILRVHDVKEAKEAITIFEAVNNVMMC